LFSTDNPEILPSIVIDPAIYMVNLKAFLWKQSSGQQPCHAMATVVSTINTHINVPIAALARKPTRESSNYSRVPFAFVNLPPNQSGFRLVRKKRRQNLKVTWHLLTAN